ncbi:MAG: hypothetical protein BWY84_00243 [Candidatus Aerophobetes bacterium ADurb.Bin490]|nr:MAG: hypothetical protein BWY84_00243 [Candidatus Aerophobetes bacterium ADurb.Bin490]
MKCEVIITKSRRGISRFVKTVIIRKYDNIIRRHSFKNCQCSSTACGLKSAPLINEAAKAAPRSAAGNEKGVKNKTFSPLSAILTNSTAAASAVKEKKAADFGISKLSCVFK